MSRKWIAAALGMTMAVSMVLSGCGKTSSDTEKKPEENKTEEEQEKPEEESSGEETVLNFYYWDEGQREGMDAMIALFEKSHENIRIETTIVPWSEYWTKLQTSLPNGTGPDIFWMNLYAQPYYEAGLLYDMTEKIEADGLDMSKYPEGVLAAYQNDGHYFGIPKDYDGTAIFYNKEIFDEMNVPYPEEGWTWEDFRETAKALTNEAHYGYTSRTNSTNVRSFILSNGGRFTTDDNMQACYNEPEAVEAYQFLHDLMYVDKSSPTASEMVETDPSDMFKNGSVAMVPDGSWMMGSYAEALGDKLGLIEMPQNVQKGCATSGLAYCMAANGSNIDAAWEFCKFAASKEAQDATAVSTIPAHKDSAEAWLNQYSDYADAHYLIDCVEYAVSNPVYGNGKTAECETIDSDAVNEAWMDENADIQAIMDKCVEKINATIAEE